MGISGVSGDMRHLRAAADAGNERAKLAIDVYINGIVRYIGAYYAELGGLDALAFTGGVGEHDARLRAEVIRQVAHLSLKLDADKNARDRGDHYHPGFPGLGPRDSRRRGGGGGGKHLAAFDGRRRRMNFRELVLKNRSTRAFDPARRDFPGRNWSSWWIWPG